MHESRVYQNMCYMIFTEEMLQQESKDDSSFVHNNLFLNTNFQGISTARIFKIYKDINIFAYILPLISVRYQVNVIL